MANINSVRRFANLARDALSVKNRPLRLKLDANASNAAHLLLPQCVSGIEAVCGGFEWRLLCVAQDAGLALKDFIGVPAELQVVTDRGQLRRHCGIITSALSGQSDGALATYQLVMRDALGIMEQRINTRVFLGMSELDIIQTLVNEWRASNAVLAGAFDLEIDVGLNDKLPKREFTMQQNQSDADFIRYLLQRRGIAWFFKPGLPKRDEAVGLHKRESIGHTLVVFEDAYHLRKNSSGRVRFHRDDATEERDTITAWGAERTLAPGAIGLYSWDYKNPGGTAFNSTQASSTSNQGEQGNQLASALEVYLMETPHVGANAADLTDLGNMQMARHAYNAKSFHGEGSVRDLACGEWIAVQGHPELDTHPAAEREFVIIEQRIVAHNNLPVDITQRVQRLFQRSGWEHFDHGALTDDTGKPVRYKTRFRCVRRGVRIVPPRPRMARPEVQSAIVVGPAGEEAWCDHLGRIKVRFPAARPQDHAHAGGAGTLDTDGDSAWVRLATNWAGSHLGGRTLPRVGAEVLIDFVGGDPDKPIIVGQVYNGEAPPPPFQGERALPLTRYQAGMRSREVRGYRGNQLRLDDTTGQISAQLASDHASTELNLGYLTEYRQEEQVEPRGEGAELRTEEAIALHAARGILLSTWKLLGGAVTKGKQLSRDDFLDLLRQCSELFTTLGQYAEEHNGLPIAPKEQDELLERFRDWEDGTNTKPEAEKPGEPVIGITSPEGIGFASSKAIVSYSAVNIDTVAQQHLQFTSGQRVNINAGNGLSMFAHGGDFKGIAHNGKLILQSQQGDVEVNADENVRVTATKGWVTISAEKLLLVTADGSFFKLGDGPPVMGSKQPLKFHAPDFVWEGAETMEAELPKFGKGKPLRKHRVRFAPGIPLESGETPPGSVVEDAKLDIEISDGTTVQTRTGPDGMTDPIERDAMRLTDAVLKKIDNAN